MNFPILSTIIFVPLLGALFIFLFRDHKDNNKSSIYVSLCTSIANLFLTLFIYYLQFYFDKELFISFLSSTKTYRGEDFLLIHGTGIGIHGIIDLYQNILYEKTNIKLFIASDVSVEKVEGLLKSEFPGYEKAKVSKLEDGTFSILIDDLSSSGNSNNQVEKLADPAIVDILNVFDKEFPVKLVLAFSPGENESEEETQEEDLPDISQIESIVESLGVGSFEIEDLRQGVYQITLTEFKHNFSVLGS